MYTHNSLQNNENDKSLTFNLPVDTYITKQDSLVFPCIRGANRV